MYYFILVLNEKRTYNAYLQIQSVTKSEFWSAKVEGIIEGREEGRKEGIEIGFKIAAISLLRNGINAKQVSSMLNIDIETINKIVLLLEKYADTAENHLDEI